MVLYTYLLYILCVCSVHCAASCLTTKTDFSLFYVNIYTRHNRAFCRRFMFVFSFFVFSCCQFLLLLVFCMFIVLYLIKKSSSLLFLDNLFNKKKPSSSKSQPHQAHFAYYTSVHLPSWHRHFTLIVMRLTRISEMKRNSIRFAVK